MFLMWRHESWHINCCGSHPIAAFLSIIGNGILIFTGILCEKMDYPWIKYLNSPELVVKVQTLLGIEYPDNKAEQGGIRVQNKFLYYLFIIGTELGDENFYACFIPCWFWNVDGAVGRRFVFVWALLMYIGQALKDVLRCPRPPKPVVKLQEKWSAEYGLPSTHAMVRISHCG